MYKLEQGLIDLINAQRAEAEEFSKKPGCFMGMMPKATDLEYWESRVPTGTLKEYNRIELEESAYYLAADAMSKGYARSLDLHNMSDADLEQLCYSMSQLIRFDEEYA